MSGLFSRPKMPEPPKMVTADDAGAQARIAQAAMAERLRRMRLGRNANIVAGASEGMASKTLGS